MRDVLLFNDFPVIFKEIQHFMGLTATDRTGIGQSR